MLCQGANTQVDQAECFIQTLRTYTRFIKTKFLLINTFFTNNTAHQSGSDIYGGQLNLCTINTKAELATRFLYDKYLYGFDYIKATTKLNRLSTTADMQGHILITSLTTSQNPMY